MLLCRAQDPRPPFTASLVLASHLCFLALDCECTQGSSIPTQLCAFSPGSTAGTLEPLLSSCPVWVFISRVCIGASLQCSWWLLLTPAAVHGVSRAFTCSSVGFPFTDLLFLSASVVWPGDHQGVCTPTTYLCQKLWRHPPLPPVEVVAASVQVGCGNKSNPV